MESVIQMNGSIQTGFETKNENSINVPVVSNIAIC